MGASSPYSLKYFFIAALASLFSALLSIFLGLEFKAIIAISIVVLCAILWVSEAIPIPATACIPLAVFPLSGVITKADLGTSLGNPINLLLIGGFLLSIAMVKTQAHLRLTTAIFSLIKPKTHKQLVATFMLCAAFLSMWISNAAATMMLIPIALATLGSELEEHDNNHKQSIGALLLIGIAYAASIGGIGTPIGTPPNLIFMQAYEQATSQTISFVDWMAWGVPFMLCLLVTALIWMLKRVPKQSYIMEMPVNKWQSCEKRVLLIFGVVVILWMTRADPFGGWSKLFNLPNSHDGYIGILGAIALFIVPNGKPNEKAGPLLEWEDAKSLPWGIVLLVSGGIAISLALKNTGLVTAFAENLAVLEHWPVWTLLAIICLCVTFLTEIMSNSAATALLMPVLAGIAIILKIDPLIIMLPAAVSASCAFMMPMATAPNAIVFASKQVPIQQMVKTGLGLNFAALAIVVLLSLFLF